MNWSKPLFPIPNTMLKWHKNHCPYIYILWKTKYSHTVVGWGSEWWTDLGNKEEIFIFRSSFYAIIDQHEIFDKKLPNLIIPKNYSFNFCAQWIHSKGCLRNISSEIPLFSVIDGQIINHSLPDQRRPSLPIFFKKYKIIIFGTCPELVFGT